MTVQGCVQEEGGQAEFSVAPGGCCDTLVCVVWRESFSQAPAGISSVPVVQGRGDSGLTSAEQLRPPCLHLCLLPVARTQYLEQVIREEETLCVAHGSRLGASGRPRNVGQAVPWQAEQAAGSGLSFSYSWYCRWSVSL